MPFNINPYELTSLKGALEKQKKKPVDQNTFMENLVLGVNKSTGDLTRGGGQILRELMTKELADRMGLPTRTDQDIARAQDAPLIGTAGGLLGDMLGSGLSIAALGGMGGASLPLGMLENMRAGAAIGALAPVGTKDSRLGNAAIGGLMAGIVPGAKKAGSYIMNKLNPLREAPVDIGLLKALAGRKSPMMGGSGEDLLNGIAPRPMADTFQMGRMTPYGEVPSYLGGSGEDLLRGVAPRMRRSPDHLPGFQQKLNRELDYIIQQEQAKRGLLDKLIEYQLIPVESLGLTANGAR